MRAAVMTENGAGPRPPRRKRASKRVLRTMAWTAGAVSFVASGSALALAPKAPAEASAPKPQVIIIKKTIKRVVWQQQAAPAAAAPKVRYVYVGGGGGGSSAPAPAPAPAKTCGSHPC